MAKGGHLKFLEKLDENICNKFGRRISKAICTCSHKQNLEPGVNSRDVIKQTSGTKKCVDLGDCTMYLNQTWYTAAPDYHYCGA